MVLLFVIEHARHRILHFNVTRHPSANWVVQQLRTGPASPSLLALSRNFVIRERQTIQLRAEAFNLPNHLNPLPPGNGIGVPLALNSPNFGKITNDISGNNGIGLGDYRVVQLALKFAF